MSYITAFAHAMGLAFLGWLCIGFVSEWLGQTIIVLSAISLILGWIVALGEAANSATHKRKTQEASLQRGRNDLH